uniref:MPN domain-containing protein n=1 Tax=Palpitomonas bilix TaxID=652834 RepID=A0A7S3G9Z0_9EUKA|mmetsp:Transcript_31718/g.82758  ORF Transcript_31718/g.82758 Transcript_31718/m.82758 type:complete len:321 (+) Transcript_31718:40-1002(+)
MAESIAPQMEELCRGEVHAVRVSHSAFHAMSGHAHAVESEEIVGVLLGEHVGLPGGGVVCIVHAVRPMKRADRRKDRVEVSPEDLSSCVVHAEELQAKTGHATQIVGWYHSHPHITIHPSHVDLNTQSQFEATNKNAVGLIVSCFDARGSVELGAFQTQNVSSEPITNLGALSERDMTVLESKDHAAFEWNMNAAFKVSNFPSHVSHEGKGNDGHLGRKWHPVFLFDGNPCFEVYCKRALIDVPLLLLEEEQELFEKAMAACEKEEALRRLHHQNVFIKSLCLLSSSVPIDMRDMMKDTIERVKSKVESGMAELAMTSSQ